MKRKILILLCAVVLVFSMGVTVFASTEKLPVLDIDEDFIVFNSSSGYMALPSSSITSYDGEMIKYQASNYYKLINGKWEFVPGTGASFQYYKQQFVYASNPIYGIVNSISFVEPIGFEDMSGYYEGLKGQITVQNVVGVLVVGVGAVIGIVFMYWGIRKGVKALMSAFRKGKISL